jgi:phosphopantothenoylcysteine synthetase/decarboxylase
MVVCGAPLASRAGDGVEAARANGWDPYVIPTDAAAPWLTNQDLGGAPVITGNRAPDSPKRIPPADAIVVAPMTFNTLNAWANGNAYTYPLTTLCAGLGARTPSVAVPFAKHDLAGHPAWLASLAVLRYAGVTILDAHSGSTAGLAPVESGTGDQVARDFQWKWVLDVLSARGEGA